MQTRSRLEFFIGKRSHRVDSAKTKTIVDWPNSNTQKGLCICFDLANLRTSYSAKYAAMARPISFGRESNSIGRRGKIRWFEERSEEEHSTSSYFGLPDPDRPFSVVFHASVSSIGGLLLQTDVLHV